MKNPSETFSAAIINMGPKVPVDRREAAVIVGLPSSPHARAARIKELAEFSADFVARQQSENCLLSM